MRKHRVAKGIGRVISVSSVIFVFRKCNAIKVESKKANLHQFKFQQRETKSCGTVFLKPDVSKFYGGNTSFYSRTTCAIFEKSLVMAFRHFETWNTWMYKLSFFCRFYNAIWFEEIIWKITNIIKTESDIVERSKWNVN